MEQGKYYFEAPVEINRTNHYEKKSGKEPMRLQMNLVLAYQIEDFLHRNQGKTMADVARMLGLSRARVTQIVMWRYLAPEIQDRIVINDDSGLKERMVREYLNKQIK